MPCHFCVTLMNLLLNSDSKKNKRSKLFREGVFNKFKIDGYQFS